MNTKGHELLTKASVDLLTARIGTSLITLRKSLFARGCGWVDRSQDIEFVDVEWGRNDDPHSGDITHKAEEGHMFTSFNHFIDIKKGPGLLDDYDGYSYALGSASKDEYQLASEVADSLEAIIGSRLTGSTVDEGLATWYNDEYVHIPGEPGYMESCSPCAEPYSYPQDTGWPDKISQLRKRFPLATWRGGSNKGIPYSIFFPVDNLGRYWFELYLKSGEIRALSPVMHAIQDANVPHHVAGYNGNWHTQYENHVDKVLMTLGTSKLTEAAKELLSSWDWQDPNPPTFLEREGWRIVPATNWRIDQLITWIALSAYRVYAEDFGHFKNFSYPADAFVTGIDYGERFGPIFDISFAKIQKEKTKNKIHTASINIQYLAVLAIAMGALALEKAIREKSARPDFIGNKKNMKIHTRDCRWAPGFRESPETFGALETAITEGYVPCGHCLKLAPSEEEEGEYVGNFNKMELHLADCVFTKLIAKAHRKKYGTIEAGLDARYNGCYYCLGPYDLDSYGGSYLIPWKTARFLEQFGATNG